MLQISQNFVLFQKQILHKQKYIGLVQKFTMNRYIFMDMDIRACSDTRISQNICISSLNSQERGLVNRNRNRKTLGELNSQEYNEVK